MIDLWYCNDFTITEEHRKLAAHLNVAWNDDNEWGAVEFGGAKRPFGNGDMPMDVAKILGWNIVNDVFGDPCLTEKQYERARRLHFEMGYVAKALLAAFVTGLAIDGGFE